MLLNKPIMLQDLEQPKTEQIEVNKPTVQTGIIQFMNKSAFTNPAPDKLKRVLTALRYLCVSFITAVAATDLFSGRQSKIISFTLGITIIVLGAIELATGVKPIPEDQQPTK